MSVLHSDKTKPEILDIRIAAKTTVFEVQAVDLHFSNGTKRTYERLTPNRQSSVMVIPLRGDKVIMVREYAVGPERYELCFPKGVVDKGETPEEAANRELQEEIAMAARRFTPLRSVYTSPSHMFGLMHLIIAEDLYPSSLQGDEPEPLEIVELPLEEALALAYNDELGDLKMIASLFLLRDFLNRRK